MGTWLLDSRSTAYPATWRPHPSRGRGASRAAVGTIPCLRWNCEWARRCDKSCVAAQCLPNPIEVSRPLRKLAHDWPFDAASREPWSFLLVVLLIEKPTTNTTTITIFSSWRNCSVLQRLSLPGDSQAGQACFRAIEAIQFTRIPSIMDRYKLAQLAAIVVAYK
jgi:hypothetical protein